MVKKLLLLAVLALALPLAAFAGSVDFTNTGGTLSGSASGLSLSGSTLTVVNGLYGGGLITGPISAASASRLVRLSLATLKRAEHSLRAGPLRSSAMGLMAFLMARFSAALSRAPAGR